MARNKREYLIGYKGQQQSIYGPDVDGKARWVDRMTIGQALRRARDLQSPECRVQVFQLVPVAEIRVRDLKKYTVKNGRIVRRGDQ